MDKVFNFRLSSVNNEIAILLGRKSICIWNLSTRKRKFEPIGLDGSATCIRYSPKGEYVAIGDEDGSIRIMYTSDGAMKNYTLSSEKSHHVKDLIFSSDSKFVCSSYSDSTDIRVWNTLTGQLNAEFSHMTTISSIAFTPDGRYILSAGFDGSMGFSQLIEERNEVSVRRCQLSGSYGIYPKINVSLDGRYLVTCSDSKDLRVWSIPDAVRELKQPDEDASAHKSDITSVDYSPDGTIVSASLDGSIFTWNSETGRKSGQQIFAIHTFAQFSPNGDQIVTCSGNPSVIVWDTKTKQRCRTLNLSENDVYKYCFYSYDGRYIIALTDGTNRINVWDSSNGECLSNSGDEFSRGQEEDSDMLEYDVADLAISPTSNHIIFMDNPNMVHYVYDFLLGKVLHAIRTDWVYSYSVYSPDGTEIARVEKNTLFFYDALRGSALGEPITLDIDTTTEFTYSPDGKHLILACADLKIWIVERETVKIVIGPIRGHTEAIPRMKFSKPDGRYLVTGSADDTVRIWDMNFIMGLSDEGLNSVINMYEGGTHSIGVELETAANKEKTATRRIMPRSIMKDGWYRNAEGGLLFWVPPEYRMDAVDLSKTCIPATARQELNYDFKGLSLYEGRNWVKIFSGMVSLYYP